MTTYVSNTCYILLSCEKCFSRDEAQCSATVTLTLLSHQEQKMTEQQQIVRKKAN